MADSDAIRIKGTIALAGGRAFLYLLASHGRATMTNVEKSKLAKKYIFALIKQYEETHTTAENRRLCSRLRDKRRGDPLQQN